MVLSAITLVVAPTWEYCGLTPRHMQFIDCKRDGSVTNFNISVAITDEFMRALEADGEYDVVDPSTGR